MGEKPWHDEELLRELYVEKGLDQTEIGEELGCSQRTVSHWMNRLGVETEGSNWDHTDPWTDEETLRKMYVQQGMKSSEIGDKLGCSHGTVLRWLRRHEIDADRNAWDYEDTPWRDESLLREMYVEQNMGVGEIGKELGCMYHTVSRWIEEFGIERDDPELPWDDEERLEELYWDEGMSLSEIGDELGCSAATVRRRMEEHDIPRRRSRSEKPPWFGLGGYGYEKWGHHDGEAQRNIRVHRLLAVAEYGFDAVCDMEVHHKNGVRWDNRSDNIEVMDPSEHRRLHAKKRGFGKKAGT